MEHANGTILTSPYGHDVVRVPLSPSQDVWLATDVYRGWFSDEEVAGWVQPTTFHVEDNVTGKLVSKDYDEFSQASNICRALYLPNDGGRYGVYNDKGERVLTDPEEA